MRDLRARGYDTDPEWSDDSVFKEDKDSPTGFVVLERFNHDTAIYALAT